VYGILIQVAVYAKGIHITGIYAFPIIYFLLFCFGFNNAHTYTVILERFIYLTVVINYCYILLRCG